MFGEAKSFGLALFLTLATVLGFAHAHFRIPSSGIKKCKQKRLRDVDGRTASLRVNSFWGEGPVDYTCNIAAKNCFCVFAHAQ
jgi:hypothetical protein